MWETDGNLAVHAVNWGRSNIVENVLTKVETVEINPTHFVHRATITGLSPETSYVYRVRSGSTTSPTYTFRTAPLRDTPFTVAWWGDSQANSGILRQLVTNMTTRGVDWMGVAGDLVSSGASLDYWADCWFGSLESSNLGQTHPALFARGNHDTEYPYCYAYSDLPGNGSWYAFNYGNSRFIFLDTEATTASVPEQYAWLTNELTRTETQQAAFRVVCFHRLPYSDLWNGGGYTGEPWVRQDWAPLFQQYHVDMVINGHAHCYQRGATNGVTYLVVGGGGGEIDTERVADWPGVTVVDSLHHYGRMHVNGSVLDWTAYDLDDNPLDSFTLKSRIPVLGQPVLIPGQNTFPIPVSGKPGTSYVTEQSSDLITWSPIATNAIPIRATGLFTNYVPLTPSPSFFRVNATP
jgi:predicted phosphodiesterase